MLSQLLKESENGPWKPKCQFDRKNYKGEITPETFLVDLALLRPKRTIQQKIVEFMVLKLFCKQSILSLIDILFKDMKEDYKIFENDDEEEEPEIEAAEECSDMDYHPASSHHPKEDSEQEEDVDDIDPTKYGVDLDQYMSIKGVLTIERIKDIVGEIMSSCAGKMKFEILEVIMKGVIFENKKLRESFMQEILNSAQNATYRVGLEQYLNQNELHCREYFAEKGTVFENPIHERIIEFAWVDVNYKFLYAQSEGKKGIEEADRPDINFYQRIMIITTEGI